MELEIKGNRRREKLKTGETEEEMDRRSVQEDLNVKNSYLIFLAYFESF
jgi:hypothetical protein